MKWKQENYRKYRYRYKKKNAIAYMDFVSESSNTVNGRSYQDNRNLRSERNTLCMNSSRKTQTYYFTMDKLFYHNCLRNENAQISRAVWLSDKFARTVSKVRTKRPENRIQQNWRNIHVGMLFTNFNLDENWRCTR